MRLGDLDALKEDLKQYFSDGTLDSVSAKLAFNMILRKIDEAPTVELFCSYLSDGEVKEPCVEAPCKHERTPGDLISRSEAEKLGATCLARRNENGQLEAIISLDNAPTVEQKYYERVIAQINPVIEARPHGEWIIIKSPLSNETIVKCDKCGDEFIGNDVEDYNFCPNCGADMQKGGNNE